ncbi:MAG: hypothetical protein JST28_07045 [Acidobacteria bacterium]|nr:hypothetical protein [Acidobacteriota bacterium]
MRLTCLVLFLVSTAALPAQNLKLLRLLEADSAELTDGRTTSSVHVGARFANWTLMAIAGEPSSPDHFAVLEDFTTQTGHLVVIDTHGIRFDLPKTAEPTWADPAKLYNGHKLEEVINNPSDLLGDEVLSRPGDPDYDTIAPLIPPIQKINTYSFVGTPNTADKVGFAYGGRSPDFDPAPYDDAIRKIREEGRVLDGIVGGWLPILRFVYPETPDKWTEMITFAPFRTVNGNNRIQPVWYRIVHVENGSVAWTRYVDSYHPFPPRTDYDRRLFYRDLISLRAGWQKLLAPAMKIEVPDTRLQNMAQLSLVREMMTRINDYPKYGVVDRDYGGSEHDGFPDTFTVDTTAMLEWGLIETAGRYIDNYLGKFVRDDGSLLYRGPETGQYGRMLSVLAQYVNYGGDPALLVRHRTPIDGITRLLLGMRDKAKQLPRDNPAYGMLAGWSEADASLDPDPPRYMQPYFSNSAEAAQGFRDLGHVWSQIGKQQHSTEVATWGDRLVRESTELQSDLQTSISRSLLHDGSETILPSIAGAKEPFHVVVPRDPTDPQFRSYRAYMEMMYSGLMTKDDVNQIDNYRRTHHDIILGIPTAYGYKTGAVAGFLAYGHAYGLIQHDMNREALLLLYSIMAHQYTRGTWTAPETRPVFDNSNAAPYCTPAQLIVPLMAKWLLVFEDPNSDTLWFGKSMPEQWLEDGQKVSISDAPTRFGRVSFSTASHLTDNRIEATLNLPPNFKAAAKLRLRVHGQRKLVSVTLNGKPWRDFTPEGIITVPPDPTPKITLTAHY